jgi:hypothetical protein
MLTVNDKGQVIKGIVTATNSGGATNSESNGTGAIIELPYNIDPPTISGTTKPGNTLTAQSGNWGGSTPINYTYQWKRDGVNISGATSNTYIVTSGDIGKSLTVSVTAANTGGSATQLSNSLGPVTSDRYLAQNQAILKLIFGQSNAVGFTNTDVPVAEQQFPIDQVFIERATNDGFETLDYGTNNQGNLFGIELSEGLALKNIFKKPVFIAKVAVSGAPVNQEDGRQDWNVNTAELALQGLNAGLAAQSHVVARGYEPYVILDWLQYERDCKDATFAAGWKPNFTALVNYFRANGLNIRAIVLNKVNLSQSAGTLTDRTTVSQGVIDYAAEHSGDTFLIDMNNYNFIGGFNDNVHYPGSQIKIIGEDFAAITRDQVFSDGFYIPTYSADVQGVIDRFASTPPAGYISAIQTLVDGWISDYVWQYVTDFTFYGMDTEANSLRPWKGLSTEVNHGATHVPKVGFDFNGTSSYIDTGWIPSTMGFGRYNINNALFGWHVVTNDTPGTGRSIGGVYSSSSLRMGIAQASATSVLFRVNSGNSGSTAAIATFGANNLYLAKRNASSGSTSTTLYQGSTGIVDANAASQGLPTHSLYSGAVNNAGSPLAGSYFDGRLSCRLCAASVDSSLTLIGISNIISRYNTFKTAIAAL